MNHNSSDNFSDYDNNGDFIPFPDLACVTCNRSPADGEFSQEGYLSVPVCLKGDCVDKIIARRKRVAQYLSDKEIQGVIIPPVPMLDEVESKFDALYDEVKKHG